MRREALPLTYDECRARFRRAAEEAGLDLTAHPLAVRGPHDQELTLEVTAAGSASPRRALVVLSGVHGVEGFISSALQCAPMEQLSATYQEQWVHNHGDLGDPVHRAIARTYRECFTPDDPEWESEALRRGGRHLGAAVAAVSSWS